MRLVVRLATEAEILNLWHRYEGDRHFFVEGHHFFSMHVSRDHQGDLLKDFRTVMLDVDAWCAEQFGPGGSRKHQGRRWRWQRHAGWIRFVDEIDATAFRIRWG